MWLPSASEVVAWHERGFLVTPPLFSAFEIAELHAHASQLCRPAPSTPLRDPLGLESRRGLLVLENPHWSAGILRQVCLSRSLTQVAQALLCSRSVRVWASQILCKHSNSPSAVGWHQDFSYWACLSCPRALTAWIPLSDVSYSRGGMAYRPGSHRSPQMSADGFCDPSPDLWHSTSKAASDAGATVRPSLMSGEVAFHHCLTLHASGPNTDDRPRIVLAISYIAHDCNYAAGLADHHINVQAMKACGHVEFRGPLFPSSGQEALHADSAHVPTVTIDHRQQ